MKFKIRSNFALYIALLTSSIFTQANAYQIRCANNEYTILMSIQEGKLTRAKVSGWLDYKVSRPAPIATLNNKIAQYEFIVNDSNDTNIFFGFYLSNGQITKKEILQSGNDSDNYVGVVIATGDDAFNCIAE